MTLFLDKAGKMKSPEVLQREKNLYNTTDNFHSERQEYNQGKSGKR